MPGRPPSYNPEDSRPADRCARLRGAGRPRWGGRRGCRPRPPRPPQRGLPTPDGRRFCSGPLPAIPALAASLTAGDPACSHRLAPIGLAPATQGVVRRHLSAPLAALADSGAAGLAGRSGRRARRANRAAVPSFWRLASLKKGRRKRHHGTGGYRTSPRQPARSPFALTGRAETRARFGTRRRTVSGAAQR